MRNEASFREHSWQPVSSRSQETLPWVLESRGHAAEPMAVNSGFLIVPDLAVFAQI